MASKTYNNYWDHSAHHWVFAERSSLLRRNHWSVGEKQQMFTNHLNNIDAKCRCDADMQLTAANGNDIVVVIVVIYLNDLRRQLSAAPAFILRAALAINQTVPLVRLLYQFLTLLYGPDGEQASHIKWGNTQSRLYLLLIDAFIFGWDLWKINSTF